MQIELDIGGIYYFIWSVLILVSLIAIYEKLHDMLGPLNTIREAYKNQQHINFWASRANPEKQAPQPV